MFSVVSVSVRCPVAQLPFPSRILTASHLAINHHVSSPPSSLSLSLSAPACYLCCSNTIACACPSRGLQAIRRQAVCPHISCRLCPSTSQARRIAHLPFPFKMSRLTTIRPLPLKPPSRRHWRLRGLSRSLKGSIVILVSASMHLCLATCTLPFSSQLTPRSISFRLPMPPSSLPT
ncbi:hypothetical protein EDB86DRAFT_3107335, partial [Lactarius hatsudake]